MEIYQKKLNEYLEAYYFAIEDIIYKNKDIKNYLYDKKVDKKYGTYDKNYDNRLKISIAVLFDKKTDKKLLEDFIRKIFLEEIKNRERNSSQGIGTVLETLTFLLKRYENKDDIKLFKRAKKANFDCNCGYDINIKLKDCIENLNIKECINYTYELKAMEILSDLVTLWINSQEEWNIKNLQTLKYYEKIRNNKIGLLEATKKIYDVSEKGKPWDIVLGLSEYCKMLIETDKYEEAWEKIKYESDNIESIYEGNWYNIGLGRNILEICAELIIKAETIPIKKEIWDFIYPAIYKQHNAFSFNLYDKLIKISYEMNDLNLYKKLEKEYKKLKNI